MHLKPVSRLTFFFALCLFVSSSLLMAIQPMVARLLLPHLGGSPAVWNTCMVFFQAGLLLGYGYAYLGPRWLGVRLHAGLHVLLLVAALALVPVAIAPPEHPPARPILWLLHSLLLGVGAPYFLLASSGSLLQRWFAEASGREPYFLYSASNVGSFLGLLAYPLVVERWWTLAEQAGLWRAGFALLTGLSLVAAILATGHAASRPGNDDSRSEPLGFGRIVRWVLLALAPSSLMLSVTQHLTSDLAPVPLLWIVPLGLYLATFAVVFASRPWIPHDLVARYVPVVILLLLFLWLSEATSPLLAVMAIYLLGFTALALYCHGELVRTRPPVAHLAAFYFWLALGGVLGGIFNAIIAPLVFNGAAEFPLVLVLVGLLRPPGPQAAMRWRDAAQPLAIGIGCLALVVLGRALEVPGGPVAVAFMFGVPLAVTLFEGRPLPYALSLAGILLASMMYPGVHGPATVRVRSFFGIHRVTRDGDLVQLVHGNTVHGVQSLLHPREPLAYYHRGAPVADLLRRLDGDGRRQRVGVVGLGTGTLAAYGRAGESWTFFEIDPEVLRLAQNQFTYLDQSAATIHHRLGDARLTLRDSADEFGLLIVDAFGSDAIPAHLLTTEALDLYSQRLRRGGLLLFHVSNRYLDLFPVLAEVAHKQGWLAWGSRSEAWPVSPEDERGGKRVSWWVLLAARREDVAPLRLSAGWQPLPASPHVRPWTDDFTHLFDAIRWREVLQ